MHIINAFRKCVALPFQALATRRSTDGETNRGESESLLENGLNHSPSLTSEYQDFLHSNSALWQCLLHSALYYTFAVVNFSYLLTEKFTIIDSLYFATTVFTTVGYGDLKPVNNTSKIVTMALAGYGIVILGLFLGVAGEWLIDKHNEAISTSRKQLNNKLLAGIEARQSSESEDQRITDPVHEKTIWEEIGYVALQELPILSIVLIFALILGHYEGWTILESVYWSVVTGTTIGFGDDSPTHQSVRLACCFFLPFCVMVLGEFLSRIASLYMERSNQEHEHNFLKRALTLGDLEAMDENADGTVCKAEFLSYMLVALQKVEKDEIERINELFHKLDVTHSGNLTKNDIANSDWSANFRHTLEELVMSGRFQVRPRTS